MNPVSARSKFNGVNNSDHIARPIRDERQRIRLIQGSSEPKNSLKNKLPLWVKVVAVAAAGFAVRGCQAFGDRAPGHHRAAGSAQRSLGPTWRGPVQCGAIGYVRNGRQFLQSVAVRQQR